jgi:hypothetical protein
LGKSRKKITSTGSRRIGNRIRAPLLSLIPFLLLASPAAGQEVTTQFWPEIDTFIRLGERSRIYVPLSNTREGMGDSENDGTVGVYFDYYVLPIAKVGLHADDSRRRRVLLRAGYGYTAAGGGQPATNALSAEATGRAILPWELLASLRNRFDLNFTGGEFDPRYRIRLRVERDVVLGKPMLTPYVYGESFYSFDHGNWFKTRAALGLEFHLWERFVPELYFQRDYNASGADVNGFGLVVSIYFR